MTTRLVKTHWFVLMSMAIAAVMAFALSPLVNKFSLEIEKKIVQREKKIIENALQQEVDYSLARARQLVLSGSLDDFIKTGDVVNIISILNDERAREGDNLGFVAVNEDGIALSRVPTIANRGDFVFQTTPWGRLAAEGKQSGMIGVGRAFPLITSGAYPIIKYGKIAGAVFAGFWFDDEYVIRFKQKYLQNKTELVFYSKQEGVLGNSFNDPEVKKLIEQYFGPASDMVKNGRSGQILHFAGQYYFQSNIIFPSPDGTNDSPGGLIILSPFCIDCQSFMVFSIGAILFLLALLHTHRYHLAHRNIRQNLVLIFSAGLGVAVFVVLLFFGVDKLLNNVIEIEKRSYVIYNATLSFDPQVNIIDAAMPQRIAIKMQSGGEAINAVQTAVEYDPRLVRVIDISMTNSFCGQDFILEKNVDNKAGLAVVACGLPNPGFRGRGGIVAELLVEPLLPSEFTLRFADSTKVLANDGLGTNVLRQVTNGSYRTNFAGEINGTGVIPFSSTHPNNERWYSSKTIAFSWPRHGEAEYFYILDQSPKTSAVNQKITSENNIFVDVARDGIYYFHVASRNKDGSAGPTSHFKVKIDSTLPVGAVIEANTAMARSGEVVRFKFSAQDETSGLQRNYYVKIDNSEFLPTLPELSIAFSERGAHLLTLRVFDNAGNFLDTTAQIKVK